MKRKIYFSLAVLFFFTATIKCIAQCYSPDPQIIGTVAGGGSAGYSECSFGTLPMTVSYFFVNSPGAITAWGISPGNTISSGGIATWNNAVAGVDYVYVVAGGCTTYFYIQPCCSNTTLSFYDTDISTVVTSGIFGAALYWSGTAYVFSGVTFTINGYFDCTASNVEFINCHVYMGAGAAIYITGGGFVGGDPNLHISGTTFEATAPCNGVPHPLMWRGFRHNNTTYYLIENHSQIYDAQYPILLNHALIFRSFDTYWDRNYISIYAPPFASGNFFEEANGALPSMIEDNFFDGTDPTLNNYFGQDPPTLGYPYAGILVHDLQFYTTGRALPTSISSITNNYFLNLNNGIIGYNSELDVYNCHFENIATAATYSLGGFGIFSSNASATTVPLLCGDYDGADTYHNEFLNCFNGAFAKGNVDFTAKNNKFIITDYQRTYENGLWSSANFNRSINFEGNTFDVYQRGIYVQDALNADLSVTKNIFNHTYTPVGPPYLSALDPAEGIYVNFPVASSFNTADISSNDFTNGRNNIYVINASATASRLTINYNTMHFDLPFSQMYSHNHFGIWLDNVRGAWMETNTIDRLFTIAPALPPFPKQLRGFNFKDVTRSTVLTNTCTDLGTDVRLVGNCPNTFFLCNAFTATSPPFGGTYFKMSFFINGATMSSQTLGGLNGNTWSGIDASYGGLFRAEGASAVLVNWYYNGSSPYDPNPHNVTPPVFFNPFIIHANPCDFLEPKDEEGLHNIVNDQVNYSIFPVQFNYGDKKYAYETLKEDETLRSGSNDFETFYSEQNDNNIGKFSEANDFAMNQQWDEALAKINSLVNPTQIEQYKQVAAQIAFTTLRDHRALTQSEINTLTPIAYMTSWEGGEAVFIARALLRIEVDDQEQNLRLANPNSSFSSSDFYVFPNPTKGNLTIYSGLDLENATADIFNSLGQKILSLKIKQREIDLSQLSEGIYTLKVFATSEIFTSRITIIK